METHGVSLEQATRHWTDEIPLGRLVAPDDIADAVAFLSSESAQHITGEAMNVSGGAVSW
jgi:3-oxoacyl-[acyl-carrier protein] reductase